MEEADPLLERSKPSDIEWDALQTLDYLNSWDLRYLSNDKTLAVDVVTNINNNIMMIKCFHNYLAMEESSAFILHSSMKGFKDVKIGITWIS